MRALCVLVLASLVYSSLSLPSNLRRKLLQGGSGKQQSCAEIVNNTTPNGGLSNVKVQLYMMSACKAGQAALGSLLPSVTSCPSLTLHVDFIGHGTAQQGFSSTLGRNDVIGDVYMLCAQRIFATKAVAPLAIPYFKCLLENGDDDLAVYGETCKSKVGSTDFQEAVYRCVRSRTVSFALEESFKRASDAKAVISPTIFVNDEPYCGPRTEIALEDAIAKAIQGIGMKQLGECNKNFVSSLEPGCADKGQTGSYSILLFMILFSSTATLMVIACFAAFRRYPAGRLNDNSHNYLPRALWLTNQGPNGAQQSRMSGTPSDVIDNFEKIKFQKLSTEEDEEDQCSICICEYEAGEEVLVMPCSHRFHGDCIKQWLAQSTKCPLCNQQVDRSGMCMEPTIENEAIEEQGPATATAASPSSVVPSE
jgi:hypothetical protein